MSKISHCSLKNVVKTNTFHLYAHQLKKCFLVKYKPFTETASAVSFLLQKIFLGGLQNEENLSLYRVLQLKLKKRISNIAVSALAEVVLVNNAHQILIQ